MKKLLLSPLVRISFGLVMLTTAILLVTDLLGLIPNLDHAELKSRKVIAESLAVQVSANIQDHNLASVEETIRSVVERNQEVLSAALRKSAGGLLAEYGQHGLYWSLKPGEKSVPTQVRVPIYENDVKWGAVELSFKELGHSYSLFSLQDSLLAVILFMAVSGFSAYLLFLKRIMRELNPDAVIPERVRTALDTLSEGLIIIDANGNILFANLAFARKTGWSPKELLGKKSDEMGWEMSDSKSQMDELPWFPVLRGEESLGGASVRLTTSTQESYRFVVNASPVTAGGGEVRGALVTFDDITEVEAKNEELQLTLGRLEETQREITRQNQELNVLATRDPLTGALNRRSLFQGFDTLLEEARRDEENLGCIMVDIDHFKSVNDRFGHAVGDRVIKLLTRILTQHSRPSDLVGRLGGEEFCVVLPGLDMDGSAEVAERMRIAVENGEGARFTSSLRITSSFGVSALTDPNHSASDLVEAADKALYEAKETGRNRVIQWHSGMAGGEENEQEGEQVPEQEAAESEIDQVVVLDDEGDAPVATAAPVLLRILPNIPAAADDAELDDSAGIGESSIPGRVLLFDRIEQSIRRALRYDYEIGVVVIGIETLQVINDTLGSVVAEKLIKSVVLGLKHILRSTDTVSLAAQDDLMFSVSRLGSNEIVVLLSDLNQRDIVHPVLNRIVSIFEKPATIEGNEIHLDVKAGVSVYPADGENADMLVRAASSALREARKEKGKVSFRFYDPEIHQRSLKRIRLEADLHSAIEHDELVVYYQPKVDLKTGDIAGMEALLRWNHPKLGLVPPSEFIHIAEQTGLIEKITQWLIHSVCRQMVFWRETGNEGIRVAVNFSPVEFRNPDLAKNIIRILEQYPISAYDLEVEITEGVMMKNLDTAVETLTELDEAGCSIAIDDFGTGYSSLSYLKRFPVSKLKIDRSFITGFTQGQQDAAIVSAIIAMAQSLGMRVVAEGVETDEQLRFLQDLQCDEIQGYLISEPLPKEEIGELLQRSSSIKRRITDHGLHQASTAANQGARPNSSMMGILNEFPSAVSNGRR